jgi:hypothetical protein
MQEVSGRQPQRRIWCERVPYQVLTSKPVLQLLTRYRLKPLVAVLPEQMADVGNVARLLSEKGIPFGLWPMIANEQGRWANTHNVHFFSDYISHLLETLENSSALPEEIVLDIEPDFALLQALSRHRWRWNQWRNIIRNRSRGFNLAHRSYQQLIRGIQQTGVRVTTALVPLVLFDQPPHLGWQRMLGIPADDLGWDHGSVMLYTSILEGWSRSWVSRPQAKQLLAISCQLARARFGERAGVSLGLVGTGALGDEPIYRNAQELREDVAICNYYGLEQRSLFNLGGILERPPPEQWLEAFVSKESCLYEPETNLISHAAVRSAKLVSNCFYKLFHS